MTLGQCVRLPVDCQFIDISFKKQQFIADEACCSAEPKSIFTQGFTSKDENPEFNPLEVQ